jgi:hypothetical protein
MLLDAKVVWPPKTYWIFDKAFLAIAKYMNSNAKTRELPFTFKYALQTFHAFVFV